MSTGNYELDRANGRIRELEAERDAAIERRVGIEYVLLQVTCRAETAEAKVARVEAVLTKEELGPVGFGEPIESIQIGRAQLADEITAALQEPEHE